MEEIIRTNQELRKQMAEDDEIISEYKSRIKALERDLEYCNQEINLLGNSLVLREDEIETLKKENKSLSIQLRKALKDVKYKEEGLTSRDNQLIGLEDKILTLKTRIKDITSQRRRMALNAPQPPAPNELIDLYDEVVDNNGHIDDYIRNPQTSAWNQRDILNKIFIVNDSVQRIKEIADWENNQAQNNYQQLGNLGNQVNQLQGQMNIVTNNFNQLHQVCNFQAGQLQTERAKHAKWKGRFRTSHAKHAK